jgi:hypothetical protein
MSLDTRPRRRVTGRGQGCLILLGFLLIELGLAVAFAWGQGWRP